MKKITLILSLSLLVACGAEDDSNDKNQSDGYDSFQQSSSTISDINASPNNKLWIAVSNPANPSVQIMDTTNDIISQKIEFDLPPNSLAFFKNNSNEERFAIQHISSDYTSSQVSIGSLIDPTSNTAFLKKSKGDYTVQSYKQTLYHIGKFKIDTIERLTFNTETLESNWNYSALSDTDEGSSNTFNIVHRTDQFAYLIRRGQATVEEVDVTATNADGFFTGNSIDLSPYIAEGANSPNAIDATIIGSELFVLLQRYGNPAYLAVFDISNPTAIAEVDTQTSTDSLKGIKLNNTNPKSMDVEGSNIFIANRGDYSSNQGGLDVVNISDYSVTTLINGDSFPELNQADGDSAALYHITDVTIVDQNTGYAALNIEEGYSTLRTELVKFNPSTLILNGLVDLSAL